MTQTTTVSGDVPMASTTPVMQEMHAEMRECVQACLECANICHQTIEFCLGRGGKHAEASHIRLLMDCAEACLMAASMMSRSSHFAKSSCALCADLCDACAETCERMGNDAQMAACANSCRQCAESCRRMIA